ncbi:substrate-binding domain-containing protein [Alloyangia mangrovi]
MEIAGSAALTALSRNVALVLVPPIRDPEAALRNVPFDGALLVEPTRDDPFLALLAARDVPTVAIGEAHGAVSAHVDLNYAQTADLLIDHLLNVGSRNFPLLIGTGARRYYEVFEARYRQRAAQVGMTPAVLRIDEAEGEAGAARSVARHLAAHPETDGLLVPLDAQATGAMEALRQAGLSVPGEVRVATRYDGLRARAETPALTAVDLQLDTVAATATNALLDLVEGMECRAHFASPLPRLVVRGSTEG